MSTADYAPYVSELGKSFWTATGFSALATLPISLVGLLVERTLGPAPARALNGAAAFASFVMGMEASMVHAGLAEPATPTPPRYHATITALGDAFWTGAGLSALTVGAPMLGAIFVDSIFLLLYVSDENPATKLAWKITKGQEYLTKLVVAGIAGFGGYAHMKRTGIFQ